MMRFTLGIAIFIFTVILGIYQYMENVSLYETKQAGLDDALSRREEGKQLEERIRLIRRMSMVSGDDQKFTIERLLDIGAPGLEWKFVGTPRQFGNNKSLYRHTFRISGPATYAESQEVLRKLATLSGFIPYRYCFACGNPPKGIPTGMKMVQIEGYLYVYDPNTFY